MIFSAPWPETELHQVHPGMTPSQYQATRRDLRTTHPEWSAEQVDSFISLTLRPNVSHPSQIEYDRLAA
jgi:hypothetical protein